MQNLDTAARRNPQAGALERKRADAAAKPFIGELKGWNAKTAHLRGRANSVYSSAEDRSLARLECGAMLAEICHRQSDFLSAIKGEPSHSRLDDVAAAFQRLIDQLQEVVDSDPHCATSLAIACGLPVREPTDECRVEVATTKKVDGSTRVKPPNFLNGRAHQPLGSTAALF